MYRINLNNKNDYLVQLIEKVRQGEDVKILCDDGSSFALLPIQTKKNTPTFGSARSLIQISDNFDDPIEGFEAYQP